MKPWYYALIIGGGYGGQAAAREISHSELPTLVVDRRWRAGYPAQSTSGIATYWLDRLGMRPADGSVAAPIRHFKLHVDGDPAGTDRQMQGFAGRDTGVVLHEDDFLGRMERETSARGKIEFLRGATVRKVTPTSEGWVSQIQLPDAKDPVYVQSNWVIDAGGYDSRNSRELRVTRKLRDEDHHQGFEVTIPVPAGHPTDTVDIWMGNQTAPSGYVWSFPASHGGCPALRVGVGTPLSIRDAGGRTIPTKHFFDRFVEDNPRYSAKPLARMGGVIPTARPDWKPRRGTFISVGDAARLCSPLHGGGIAQALASGSAAGRAVAEKDPSLYERAIRPYVAEMRQHWLLKQFILSLTNDRLRVVVDALCDLEMNIGPDVSPFDIRKEAIRRLRERGVRPMVQMIGSGRLWRAIAG